MISVRTTVFSCFIFAFASPVVALAQGGPPAQVDARAAAIGDRTVSVLTRWEADGSGSGRLLVDGRPPTTLYDGGGGAATVATGHGVWLVAYEVDAAREPFRARVVRRDGDGVTIGDEQRLSRPGGRHDLPFAVAATSTPDGFSVFFQEIQEDDPSAARTYLARLDRSGARTGALVEVPIPWSLAGAIWNGAGYHLALIYPGAMNGMRLSMVSTTPEAQPQQHPDWASAAGFVTDVHLAKSGTRILAFYRGGSGDRIFESDVTQIRGWGSEPPSATRHGAIGEGEAIVVRRDGERVRAQSVRVR
jgi:hypothetical protein